MIIEITNLDIYRIVELKLIVVAHPEGCEKATGQLNGGRLQHD